MTTVIAAATAVLAGACGTSSGTPGASVDAASSTDVEIDAGAEGSVDAGVDAIVSVPDFDTCAGRTTYETKFELSSAPPGWSNISFNGGVVSFDQTTSLDSYALKGAAALDAGSASAALALGLVDMDGGPPLKGVRLAYAVYLEASVFKAGPDFITRPGCGLALTYEGALTQEGIFFQRSADATFNVVFSAAARERASAKLLDPITTDGWYDVVNEIRGIDGTSLDVRTTVAPHGAPAGAAVSLAPAHTKTTTILLMCGLTHAAAGALPAPAQETYVDDVSVVICP